MRDNFDEELKETFGNEGPSRRQVYEAAARACVALERIGLFDMCGWRVTIGGGVGDRPVSVVRIEVGSVWIVTLGADAWSGGAVTCIDDLAAVLIGQAIMGTGMRRLGGENRGPEASEHVWWERVGIERGRAVIEALVEAKAAEPKETHLDRLLRSQRIM